MSLNYSRSGFSFSGKIDVNTYASSSPDDRYTIIPSNVKYRVDWLKARTNFFGARLKWTDLRAIMRSVFMSNVRDSSIIQRIKNFLINTGIFPVRTGHLLDFVMRTLYIKRYTRTSTRYTAAYGYQWPLNRPLLIKNPKHSSPSVGYGDWKKVKLSHVIPNVQLLYTTPTGYGLYLLNDPKALSNPRPLLDRFFENELMADFQGMFDNLIIDCHFTGKIIP